MSVDERVPTLNGLDSAKKASSLVTCNSDEFSDTMSNSSNMGVEDSECIEIARADKEKGNDALKTGEFSQASEYYLKGLKGLEKCMGKTNKELVSLEQALNLNLALSFLRQDLPFDGMQAASKVLNKDGNNIKGLLRRSVCYKQLGWYDEAKKDLDSLLALEPGNTEARKEFIEVKRKLAQASVKDKAQFATLFKSDKSLYGDRTKETEAKRAALKKEWKDDSANEGKTFDEWLKNKEELPVTTKETKEKKEKESGLPKQRPIEKAKSPSLQDQVELDEEDLKVLQETKEKGYCYFRRELTEEEKLEKLKHIPQKVDEEASSQYKLKPEEKRGVSDWNAKGTTYEEKETTTWCVEALKKTVVGVLWKSEASSGSSWETMAADPRQLERFLATMDNNTSQESYDTMLDTCGKFQSIEAKVASEPEIAGEAHIMILRGTKRFYYEFNLKLDLEITIGRPFSIPSSKEGIATYKGRLKIDDLGSADTDKEALMARARITQMSTIPSEDKIAFDLAISQFKKCLIKAICAFEDLYQTNHG